MYYYRYKYNVIRWDDVITRTEHHINTVNKHSVHIFTFSHCVIN